MPRTLRPAGWVLGLTTVALVAAAGTVGVSLVVRSAYAEPTTPSTEKPYWEQGQAGGPTKAHSGLYKIAAQGAPSAPAAQPAAAPTNNAASAAPAPAAPVDQIAQASPDASNPMAPVINLNLDALKVMEGVKDYSCVFIKRERVNGKLTDYNHIYMKLRHEPFSVYMKFLKPSGVEGREVIYVAGKNDGKMLAHSTGLQKLVGTLSLDPNGPYAMDGNAYPITAAGFKNLLERMLPAAERDGKQAREIEVQILTGAKVDGRPCTCAQVIRNVRRPETLYISRCYYDDELKQPVRTELYDWPTRAGGQPELVGEYTYTQLKFNLGFTDYDFDVKNKHYDF